MLLVSPYCPTRAHACGLRILDIYNRIREMAPDAYIELLTHKKTAIDWKYDDLDAIFDAVYDCASSDISFDEFSKLRQPPYNFDVIDFQFQPDCATAAKFRNHGRKLLFAPMELLSRAIALGNEANAPTKAELAQQKISIERELSAARIADEVVCVSKPDAAYLRVHGAIEHVTALETGVSPLEFDPSSSELQAAIKEPRTVLYVAYFGSATNVEALRWYLANVHPIVRQRVGNYRLDVVGRGDLSPFVAAKDEAVNLAGEVPSVAPFIARSRVGIAPALSGAGFRGKINQYATLGLPTVASPLAASGLAYTDGADIFVAESPELFAERIVSLLTDDRLHEEMSSRAKSTCLKNYSWPGRDETIREIYALPPARKKMYAGAPTVHAIVPSYRHARYIAKRIESIMEQTYPNIDLVVIDDFSQDRSDEILKGLQKKYGFRYIRRTQNSGSPFTAWEFAANNTNDGLIWICESDDFADPEFVERGVDAFRANPGTVLFYCNSMVIDTDGNYKGTTTSYFRDVWRDGRWHTDFVADGAEEVANYQVRGMTVPNMSSALMDANAFRKSFANDMGSFRLAGDWLFIGRLMKLGKVAFAKDHLNNFREHGDTARASIASARSQAEYIIVKYRLHRQIQRPAKDLLKTLETDCIRFIYEPASARQVFKQLKAISPKATAAIALQLAYSAFYHPDILRELRRRAASHLSSRRFKVRTSKAILLFERLLPKSLVARHRRRIEKNSDGLAPKTAPLPRSTPRGTALDLLRWHLAKGRLKKCPRAVRKDYRTITLSGAFNRRWYLMQNPDVRAAKTDPLLHYLNFGFEEGRRPTPEFDHKKYLELNADVRRAGGNPFAHYVRWGRYENRGKGAG